MRPPQRTIRWLTCVRPKVPIPPPHLRPANTPKIRANLALAIQISSSFRASFNGGMLELVISTIQKEFFDSEVLARRNMLDLGVFQ